MNINKVLSKFGRNPGYFKKVIKISKTLTTEWIFVDTADDTDDDGIHRIAMSRFFDLSRRLDKNHYAFIKIL